MMRYSTTIFATIAVAVALSCTDRAGVTDPVVDGPALAAAETVTDVSVFQDDFIESEALCTGEAVHWTGTTRVVFHQTANRGVPLLLDFIQHRIVNVSTNWTGVGETSGDTYTFISSFHDLIQSPSPVEIFPTFLRFTFHDRVIGPDGFLGFATFTAQLVINGAGEVVIETEDFALECR
jgi:hypothetical protein